MSNLKKTEERYKLNIKKWGPAGWNYLTAVALQYTPNPSLEDKKVYREFFTSNGKCIPCTVCRGHYQENLKKHPLTEDVMASPRSLSQWINTMQNEVNKSTKKPLVSYLKMVAMYLPPTIATQMLKLTPKDSEQLWAHDKELNANYAKSKIKSIAKATYRKDTTTEEGYPVCGVDSWLFWVLIVVIVILVVLFVWSTLKSVRTRKHLQAYPKSTYTISNVLV